jgi:Alpha 1,4-glycosyltransferase conserved region
MQKDYTKIKYSFSPLKFSAAIEQFCQKTPTQVLEERKCDDGKDLKIFNSTLLGPHEYMQYKNYLVDVTEERYDQEIKNAVAFHLFNKLSGNKKLSVHSKSLYVRAARDFCPISLATCSINF